MASVGVDSRPSSGDTSGLISRGTGYPPFDGPPLNDNLSGINASADMKGTAEMLVYKRASAGRQWHVCLEAYHQIFCVETDQV
jgi:hypothetical protein